MLHELSKMSDNQIIHLCTNSAGKVMVVTVPAETGSAAL